jgi:hypothetical protein
MQNSLKPSYIQIRYHSALGGHKMILPTRQYSPVPGISGFGTFTSWDDNIRDIGDMMDDLVDVLVVQFPVSVVFDDWTVFDFNEDADFFIPVSGDAFTSKTGTDSTPGWFYAVQSVFTMFDTAYGTVKLNLLDTSSRGNFAKRTGATADSGELAIFGVLSDAGNAFSSRKGFRPATLRSISLGINDELKKQYGLI